MATGFSAVFLRRASSAMRQANVAGHAITSMEFMFSQLGFDTSSFGLANSARLKSKPKEFAWDNQIQMQNTDKCVIMPF